MLPTVHFYPDHRKIQVRSGTTVLDASSKARVQIRTRCDGKMACLMCKVIIEDQTGLSPMKNHEKLKLGELVDSGYRLACQACVIGDTNVTVPEDPLKAVIRALLAKQREEDEF
ncbi:ferredoxin [Paenibacillus psychroresistens]|uniref:Ferredoxin n=1 Tax=Paenibacillus psychroresistens TaxID=1778678 RepID=A0A6B8RMX7_9BACL|nr:2Fe-2S iron-sulfur cluster-binding protein [Paenibacillus psychroresistens]QGQ96893.1 ferredoxin [Paenibacillus psychroresistens]